MARVLLAQQHPYAVHRYARHQSCKPVRSIMFAAACVHAGQPDCEMVCSHSGAAVLIRWTSSCVNRRWRDRVGLGAASCGASISAITRSLSHVRRPVHRPVSAKLDARLWQSCRLLVAPVALRELAQCHFQPSSPATITALRQCHPPPRSNRVAGSSHWPLGLVTGRAPGHRKRTFRPYFPVWAW